MNSTKRFLVIAAMLGLAAGLIACSTLTVSTDFDPAANFSQYKTFTVMPLEQFQNNTITADRIKAAITQALQARGLQPASEAADLQISVFKPAVIGSGEQQVVANDANERARGVEVEFTAVPIQGLRLSGSVGYLDAIYTSFVTNLTGKPVSPSNPCGGVVDRSDKSNPTCYLVPTRSPKWTTRFDVSYEFDLNGKGTLTPAASWSLESDHFTDTTNAPQGFQPTYSIFDASLNYDDPSGRWRISLWGKNLTDKAHRLSAVPTAGLLTQLYFAQPRTYGVELRVKLGE